MIGSDIDFEKTPELQMRPDIAAAIMFVGMAEGWFTGKRLSHYFNDKTDDPLHARKIINGLDCAAQIAGYHAKFLNAIKVIEAVETPPDVETIPLLPAETVKVSFWSRIRSFFA